MKWLNECLGKEWLTGDPHASRVDKKVAGMSVPVEFAFSSLFIHVRVTMDVFTQRLSRLRPMGPHLKRKNKV